MKFNYYGIIKVNHFSLVKFNQNLIIDLRVRINRLLHAVSLL